MPCVQWGEQPNSTATSSPFLRTVSMDHGHPPASLKLISLSTANCPPLQSTWLHLERLKKVFHTAEDFWKVC